MVTDRGLYRPGETVTVKGWVRKIKKSGTLAIIHGQILAVIKNSHYQPILTRHVEADIHGAFDFEFDLPHDCQHGMAKIELMAVFGKIPSSPPPLLQILLITYIAYNSTRRIISHSQLYPEGSYTSSACP